MTDKTENKKEDKKKKKQGPIRTGALIPFIVFVVLVVVFNLFFLDTMLKKTFEFAGSKVNGAEVNVAQVQTSFTDLKMEIKGVQFTNKKDPTMNTFVIGSMNFKMLWDALLRGKILIEDISVKDVLVLSKREKPGYVAPPPPPEEQAEKDKKMKEVLGKAEKEFEGNIFGDIAGVFSGSNSDVSAGAKGDLQSKQKLAALKEEMAQREKNVSATLKSLPTKNDISKLQSRFNSIRWKDLGNITKAPKVLQEVDKVKKDADKMIKAYNNANKVVNNHIKYVDNATKQIPKFVDEDVQAIQKRLKIPSIDPKNIAQMLFGSEIVDKMNTTQEYRGKIEKYLPPKKSKEEKEKEKVKIANRKIGVNYKFGTPNSYPLVWIKSVNINSKTKQGTMKGTIANITDDQVQINKPTTFSIIGDFPAIETRGVNIKGSFDHRGKADDWVTFMVKSFPVKDKALSNTADVKFIIAESDAKSVVEVKIKHEDMSLVAKNAFRKIKYNNSAKDKNMDLILKDVADTTKVITLDAKASGKFDNLKWDIKSNLAQVIQKTVKRQIQAKIDATKKKIKEDVERQIANEKNKIMKQVNEAKAQYNKAIADGKNQLDKFKKDIDKKRKKEEKKAKKNMFKGIKL